MPGNVCATVLTLILCLQIISYFMGGLYRSAGAFFSVRCLSGRPYSAADVFSATNPSPHSQFYLIVLSGFFALAGFFRLLGTMCQSYDHAARLASVIITIMYARNRLTVLWNGSDLLPTTQDHVLRLPGPSSAPREMYRV